MHLRHLFLALLALAGTANAQQTPPAPARSLQPYADEAALNSVLARWRSEAEKLRPQRAQRMASGAAIMPMPAAAPAAPALAANAPAAAPPRTPLAAGGDARRGAALAARFARRTARARDAAVTSALAAHIAASSGHAEPLPEPTATPPEAS